jgi:hypothetical protein
LQEKILRDLTALIDMQRQASPNQAPQRSSQQRGPTQSSQSTGEGARDPIAGQLSTSRVGSEEAGPAEPESVQQFLRGVWGNLPDRFWDRLQSAGVERFLPKYEKLIEDYYKTLAESEENLP